MPNPPRVQLQSFASQSPRLKALICWRTAEPPESTPVDGRDELGNQKSNFLAVEMGGPI